MKKLLFFAAMICSLNSHAQNYQITFTGTGASATVGSVRVENLTSGTFTTLNGGDILNLTLTTGIVKVENIRPSEIHIYPNPVTENSFMEFQPPASGDAVISVYEMTGKLAARVKSYLESSPQD